MSISRSICAQSRCNCAPGGPLSAADSLACSQTYPDLIGNALCFEPSCAGVCPSCGANNAVPPALQPAASSLPQNAITTTVQAPQQKLTIDNLSVPLPDITRALQPVEYVGPQCSLWCDLNGAIQNYPLLAIGALVAAYMVFSPKRRTRR